MSKINKEDIKILLELKDLAAPKELPKSFTENHNNIWRAFKLGQKSLQTPIYKQLK